VAVFVWLEIPEGIAHRCLNSPGNWSQTSSAKLGWSWGCVATVDANGRTIFVADANRDDGQRFVVHADDKFTAFLELERAICLRLLSKQTKS
jgi:hypothetical protein